MEDKNKEKIERIQKIKKAMNLDFAEELLNNNEIVFEYNDCKYRVTKPTYGQKKQAYEFRMKREIELMEEKDEEGKFKNKTVKQLIKLYEDRGVDVRAFDREIAKYQNEFSNKKIETGKLLKAKQINDTVLNNFEKELQNIAAKIENLSIEKASLFEFAIENRVQSDVYIFLASLVTKKQVENEWEQVWVDFQNIQDADEILVMKAAYYVSLLTDITLGVE